jgi:hypothetical protein
MYQEVLTRGVPIHEDGEEDSWVPLERAAVGSLRSLYKPRKVEQDVSEDSAYQAYIPVGVPGATPAGLDDGDMPPWEDEPHAAMFSLPLASLAEAHTTLTTLSAEEWVAMIEESPEGTRNDAKRQWANLLKWALAVNEALGQGHVPRPSADPVWTE